MPVVIRRRGRGGCFRT